MPVKQVKYEDAERRATVYVREGTSDEGVVKEVIERHVYSRRRDGFDVKPGEAWLDLGANIGSFAVYAYLRGAKKVMCFEPEPECFKLLQRNVAELGRKHGFVTKLVNAAVTNLKEKTLHFKKGRSPDDHYRATIIQSSHLPDLGELRNMHGSCISKEKFDGVKMDIEGSEFGLIDDELLPRCEKLVLEYHFSRDKKSYANFERRMKLLRKRFKTVWYPNFIHRDLENKVTTYSGMFDEQVFCYGAK